MIDKAGYWQKRENDAIEAYKKEEDEHNQYIQQIYWMMAQNINAEIQRFVSRYATKNGITYQDAMKRVNSLDIQEYSKLAKKYVQNKTLTPLANKQMQLYNLTMKVNRLEMLKSRIGLHLTSGFSQIENHYSTMMQKRGQDELQRQAGILGTTVLPKSDYKREIDVLANASFHHATWSHRLWAEQDQLRASLNGILTKSLLNGLNPTTLVPKLEHQFGVSRKVADRLMRTELARLQIGVQKMSFQNANIDTYKFMAEMDSDRTCPICRGMDGRKFSVKDMEPGLNAPPMHPNCRCTTVPAVLGTNDQFEEYLKSYDPDHPQEYADWFKEHYGDGDSVSQTVKPTTEPLFNPSSDEPKPAKKPKPDDVVMDDQNVEEEPQEFVEQSDLNGVVNPDELAGVQRSEPMDADGADNGNVNPHYGDPGYSTNCQTCVVAYEARRRGYDVKAKPNKNNRTIEMLSKDQRIAWKIPGTDQYADYQYPPGYDDFVVSPGTAPTLTPEKYLDFLMNLDHDGRYTVGYWNKGRRNSGHIVNFYFDANGTPIIKDNQRGTINGHKERDEFKGKKEILNYLRKVVKWVVQRNGYKFNLSPRLLRIDDKELNPDVVNQVLESRNNE